MGTRSLTFVYTDHYNGGECEPIINMYRQYDGYPSGHGAELAKFLTSFEAITNGIPLGDTRKVANGMGCLAAQMISHFKTDAGGIYLYPVTNIDRGQDCLARRGQDYEYHIYSDRITVFAYSKEHVFTGPWSAFEDFCINKSEE